MPKLIKKLLELKFLLLIGVFYTIFITIAFLLPASDLPKIRFLNDKIIHIVLYIVLSFIWLLFYFVFQKNQINLKNIVIVLVVCLIYGIIIELIQQLLIASRQADIVDVFANTLGALIGTLVFWNVKNRIKT